MIAPDPMTACASFASTGSDVRSGSYSKPLTGSRLVEFSRPFMSTSTPALKAASTV